MRHYKDSLIFLAVVLLAGFFFLGFQTQADETYDLKANYLMMTSAKCELNQICNFRAEIKNLGKEFALNFPLTFSLSSTNFTADAPVLVSPEINTAVGTNEYMVYSLSGVWSQPGAATLTFSVSVADHFAESDTNNNSVSLAVNVAAHDLAAEAIDILPAYPRVNQTCQIQVKVKNNGSNNLYSEAGLNLTRNFPDFSLANSSNTRPSMSEVVRAGGYLYWDYQGKFTSAGEKQLSFTIDPDDVLKEINLNNNAVTKKIVVYNATDTDLAIDSISFSLTKIILGAPLDITLGVKNAGKTSLTDALGLAKDGLSFSLPYFDYGVNDLTLDAYPTLTTSFNPDGVFHYKFHGAFSQPGNLNLVFTINRDKQLIEADYGNNATSTIVKVYKNQAEADSFSILSKQVDMVSSTTATINWTTDFNTTGVLNYGLASVNASENAVADNNNKTAHTFTLNNLKPGAKYVYMITANNGAAQKIDMENNFTMPADDLLFIAAGPTISVGSQTAMTNWSTNLISSGRIYYHKKGEILLNRAGADTLTARHEVVLKNLAFGQYDYFITSTSTPDTNVKTDWASFEIASTTPTAPTTPNQNTPTVPMGAPTTPTVTTAAKTGTTTVVSFPIINNNLYNKLKGKIILRVQDKGQAYYVSPKDKKLYSLGKPDDAFQLVRRLAIGMSDANLAKIPLGLAALSGSDSDNDGLPDALEQAVGTDPDKSDTDADGHSDKEELANGYSPWEKDKKLVFDKTLSQKFLGQILLQVQGRGQAWYINPADGKRYFLATAADAFKVMKKLGVGVSEASFKALGEK